VLAFVKIVGSTGVVLIIGVLLYRLRKKWVMAEPAM
jgi:hypothetical protein